MGDRPLNRAEKRAHGRLLTRHLPREKAQRERVASGEIAAAVEELEAQDGVAWSEFKRQKVFQLAHAYLELPVHESIATAHADYLEIIRRAET